MNTNDLIDITTERTNIDHDTVATVANHLYDVTIRTLNAGRTVTLPGVGTFTPDPYEGVTFNVDPATRGRVTGTTALPNGRPVACCRPHAKTSIDA